MQIALIDLYEIKDNEFIIDHLGTMNVFQSKLNGRGENEGTDKIAIKRKKMLLKTWPFNYYLPQRTM